MSRELPDRSERGPGSRPPHLQSPPDARAFHGPILPPPVSPFAPGFPRMPHAHGPVPPLSRFSFSTVATSSSSHLPHPSPPLSSSSQPSSARSSISTAAFPASAAPFSRVSPSPHQGGPASSYVPHEDLPSHTIVQLPPRLSASPADAVAERASPRAAVGPFAAFPPPLAFPSMSTAYYHPQQLRTPTGTNTSMGTSASGNSKSSSAGQVGGSAFPFPMPRLPPTSAPVSASTSAPASTTSTSAPEALLPHLSHGEFVQQQQQQQQQQKQSSTVLEPPLDGDALTQSLIRSAARGDCSRLEFLITQHNADPNSCDYDRRTPLHLAAAEGQLAAAHLLVDRFAASVSARDRFGSAPLDDALALANDAVADYLLSRGAALGEARRSEALLFQAVETGATEAAMRLLRCKADPNCLDYDRRAPIHISVARGDVMLTRALLRAGADPTRRDRGHVSAVDAVEQAALEKGPGSRAMLLLFQEYGYLRLSRISPTAFNVALGVVQGVLVLLFLFCVQFSPELATSMPAVSLTLPALGYGSDGFGDAGLGADSAGVSPVLAAAQAASNVAETRGGPDSAANSFAGSVLVADELALLMHHRRMARPHPVPASDAPSPSHAHVHAHAHAPAAARALLTAARAVPGPHRALNHVPVRVPLSTLAGPPASALPASASASAAAGGAGARAGYGKKLLSAAMLVPGSPIVVDVAAFSDSVAGSSAGQYYGSGGSSGSGGNVLYSYTGSTSGYEAHSSSNNDATTALESAATALSLALEEHAGAAADASSSTESYPPSPAPASYSIEAASTVFAVFRETHVTILLGFGYLLTFLRRNKTFALGDTILILTLTVQWYILCSGFVQNVVGRSLPALTVGFAAHGTWAVLQSLSLGIVQAAAWAAAWPVRTVVAAVTAAGAALGLLPPTAFGADTAAVASAAAAATAAGASVPSAWVLLGLSHWSAVPLSISRLLQADLCAGSVIVATSVLLGRVSTFQLLVISLVHVAFYALNEEISVVSGVADIGGTMIVHLFGAVFGLAAGHILSRAPTASAESGNEAAPLLQQYGTAAAYTRSVRPSALGRAGPGEEQSLQEATVARAKGMRRRRMMMAASGGPSLVGSSSSGVVSEIVAGSEASRRASVPFASPPVPAPALALALTVTSATTGAQRAQTPISGASVASAAAVPFSPAAAAAVANADARAAAAVAEAAAAREASAANEVSVSESAAYAKDVVSILATIFLWLFWPSLTCLLASGVQQQRALANSLLALSSSSVAAFVGSHVLRGRSFGAADVQAATLAGGVAIGASADALLQPGGAVALGAVAGLVSVAGYTMLQPWLKRRFGLRDVCGSSNLHLLPALVGGLASAVVALTASFHTHGYDSLRAVFPAMVRGCAVVLRDSEFPSSSASPTTPTLVLCAGHERSAAAQAGAQLGFMLCTVLLALTGGCVAGNMIVWRLFRTAGSGTRELAPHNIVGWTPRFASRVLGAARKKN